MSQPALPNLIFLTGKQLSRALQLGRGVAEGRFWLSPALRGAPPVCKQASPTSLPPLIFFVVRSIFWCCRSNLLALGALWDQLRCLVLSPQLCKSRAAVTLLLFPDGCSQRWEFWPFPQLDMSPVLLCQGRAVHSVMYSGYILEYRKIATSSPGCSQGGDGCVTPGTTRLSTASCHPSLPRNLLDPAFLHRDCKDRPFPGWA